MRPPCTGTTWMSAPATRVVAISARRKSSSLERWNGSPGLKRAMVATWRARRPRILLPSYQGKHGHPVVLSALGIDEIISLPPAATLKTYTSAYASETLEVPVEDPAVVRDIDTPADYEAEL